MQVLKFASLFPDSVERVISISATVMSLYINVGHNNIILTVVMILQAKLRLELSHFEGFKEQLLRSTQSFKTENIILARVLLMASIL